MTIRQPGRAASFALAVSLTSIITGCGGGDSPSPTSSVTMPTEAATEQSFGDIRTRIVGTAQQPVVSAAPGATVIGIAGATISDITQFSGIRTLLTNTIVFSSNRDGNFEIYRLDADGTGQTRLTNNPATDLSPSYSPDGSQIVFSSDRDGNSEIYRMNVDGTGQTRLTNNTSSDLVPSYSPDGSQIVFESFRDGNNEIYRMNANGTVQTRLTNNPATDFSPSYSPDGSQIVFSSDRDGNNEIYRMNADGTGQTRLTNNGAFDESPSYSPDGSQIVFHSNRDGNFEIYRMNVDGTGQTRLTNNTSTEFFPSYSPDGSQIVFRSNRDGNFEIYRMNADGTGQTRLTNNPAVDLVSVKPSFGVFGSTSAKLLGTGGAFGTSGGGFLLGQNDTTTTSVVTFDSPTIAARAGLRVVAQTLPDTTASNLVFSITSTTSLSDLKFYNDFVTNAPTTATVVPVSLPSGTTGAIVSFSSSTGKVLTVLPYAANRGTGSAKATRSGDTLTYTGSFSGVWNAKGENKAPSGASTVRINATTGALLGFE